MATFFTESLDLKQKKKREKGGYFKGQNQPRKNRNLIGARLSI